jgi:predicted O-linked N-acetylglucosamine transferase (SPINDLY family)
MINVSTAGLDERVEAGLALLRAGRVREAGDLLMQVLAVAPQHVKALRGMAEAATRVGNHTLASELARAALEVEPGHVATLLVLGHALLVMARATEAVEVHERAVGLAPEMAAAWTGLGLARLLAAEAEEAREAFARACALAPGDAHAASSHLYSLTYLEGMTPAEVFEAHRRWGAAQVGAFEPHGNGRDPERRLRVGYVSADFRNHAVARFFVPLLEAHDRERAEVFCYYNHRHEDAVTKRVRAAAAGWREIVGMRDEEAAERIRADGIDVLVDLSGHTADDRLGLFARKPAPVQMTYLGYPNTTGLPAMDYRITDALADPAGAEALHTEKLLRVAAPFLCFEMPANLPAVVRPPAEKAGHVTFGSFNTLVKLTPGWLRTWGRILNAVAGSRLLVKSAALGDAKVRGRILAQFAACGIGPERVTTAGHLPNNTEHLALYNEVDVALDTFPYHGTTTTCEALAMGVPVVTRAGAVHYARVGVSLLTAVGHAEWVAADEEAYVKIAVGLAGDVGKLAEVRERLRGELVNSPLTDAKRLAREIEGGFRAAWRAWCRAGV